MSLNYDIVKKATIYQMINDDTKKIYIGSTRKELLNSRLSEHRCDYNRGYKCSSRHLFPGNVRILPLKVLLNCSKSDIKREEYEHIQIAKLNTDYELLNQYGLTKIPFGLGTKEYQQEYRKLKLIK